MHSRKRNRLEHQRLNDIVYVHCNLRLHQRYLLFCLFTFTALLFSLFLEIIHAYIQNFCIRSKTITRNYDPISLDEIRKGNEAWIVEDNPPRLNAEELNEFRSELAALSIQCSDGNMNLSSTLVKSRPFQHIHSPIIASNLICFFQIYC